MRLIGWFLAFSLVLLGIWMVWGEAWETAYDFDSAVRRLETAGPWGWAVAMSLLIADLVLPVPGSVVMSGLGYIYGALLGGLIGAAGSMLAGIAGYGLGRVCGERFARRWLGNEDFEQGEAFFERGGGWVVAASRALPILPEAIACMAGLVRMPFGRFTAALACGSVPVGLLFAAIGALGKEAPGWTVIFSVVVPLALWAVARRVGKDRRIGS